MQRPAITPVILGEDNHILVVVKPANLPVQADASGDLDFLSQLKDFIRQRDQKPGNVFLGLVHRLDRPTRGVMVFAKTSKAAARLACSMQDDKFIKEYYAVLRGGLPPSDSSTSDGWTHWSDWLVKDHASNMVRVVEPDQAGAKWAGLSWQGLRLVNGLGLVRIRLETGRSHQIRVQSASRGFPVWGDMRYDEGANRPGMQLALLASHLAFPHPVRDEVCQYSIQPDELEPWIYFYSHGRLIP